MHISVAEKLYKKINPHSKMDVPSSIYVTTEKWFKEWMVTKPSTFDEKSFFAWCVKNKSVSLR